jgi:proteasome accessory factor B
VSAKKTERLLNLVICLLATRRYLTVQQIRGAVPGYDQDTEDAFRRMFERDKEELRELGIPLETGTSTSAHDDELGYRIARRDYELPEISLEADEAAALGLAARLWQSAPLAGATGSALLKLRAAGVEAPSASTVLEPRVAATEPAFEACLAASATAGPWPSATAPAAARTPRSAASSRGASSPGAAAGTWSASTPGGPRSGSSASPGSSARSRSWASPARSCHRPTSTCATPRRGWPPTSRAARPSSGCARAPGWELRRDAPAVHDDGDGWDRVEVGFSDPERLADRVTGLGADAVVLSPPRPATPSSAGSRRWPGPAHDGVPRAASPPARAAALPARPARRAGGRRRRRVRHHRGPAAQGPGAALGVRPARSRPR